MRPWRRSPPPTRRASSVPQRYPLPQAILRDAMPRNAPLTHPLLSCVAQLVRLSAVPTSRGRQRTHKDAHFHSSLRTWPTYLRGMPRTPQLPPSHQKAQPRGVHPHRHLTSSHAFAAQHCAAQRRVGRSRHSAWRLAMGGAKHPRCVRHYCRKQLPPLATSAPPTPPSFRATVSCRVCSEQLGV